MSTRWWRKLWRERQADIGAITVIILFFTVFFWRALWSGKFPMAADPLVYSYPLRKVAWEMIRGGALPLWTPLLFSGYPLFSMAALGIGYPLTWGYLFLPGHWAEQLYVLAPFVLAPAFTYAYAREIGRTPVAALLAGLSFGYGGMMASWLANGMMTNAVTWLPLMLIGIERARTHHLALCLVWTTGAYTMSVLTGIGQGFLYVGIMAVAYAAFIGTSGLALSADQGATLIRWVSWPRWRPLLVAVGAIIVTVGLTAFQTLEAWGVAQRSIRSNLSYQIFGEYSRTFLTAWKSLLMPLYYFGFESPAYVQPLAVGLAVMAVLLTVRHPRREPRVIFWLMVAVVAWALMLGVNTPLYWLVYHVPLVNRFRGASRHSFEWTFAMSILAAYGWDAMRSLVGRKQVPLAALERRGIILGLIALTLSVMVGAYWWMATDHPQGFNTATEFRLAGIAYLLWKAVFMLLLIVILWQGWQLSARRWRSLWLVGAVILACFVEPFILFSRMWNEPTLSVSRFTAVSPATRFLQQYPPEQNRVYTRVNLFVEQYSTRPRLDPPNLTALYGLHNVAGYEPLIWERYSRALGNVGLDGVTPRHGFAPDQTLFEPDSHVLDLLNTRFVAAFSNLALDPIRLVEKEGVAFHVADFPPEVSPDPHTTLTAVAAEGDTLAVVTTLANAAEVAEGTPIAKLFIYAMDGRVVEHQLCAGTDTAEWAHARSDVRPIVRHPLAPVFDNYPKDADFPAYRYWSRIALGKRLRVDRVEIVKLVKEPVLRLWKATLYDSGMGHSTPLVLDTANRLRPVKTGERWQPVYNQDGVLVLRNRRALPRAWLAAEAEAVDGEEALRRIRGESERRFDPWRTALLEISPKEMPALPGGSLSPDAAARIVHYEPNRLVIETTAGQPSVLVLSEMNYPGWAAWLDGAKTPIYPTNYLLRGVALPAGAHRVEMRYTAPAVRIGALISLLTLLLLGSVAVYARRTSSMVNRGEQHQNT